MKPHITIKIATVLSMLALSCFCASAQGNLVVNGGFDTDASGWAITNVNNGGGYQSSFGNPAGSILLYNAISTNNPTASQEINSLTPGTTYIISGDYWSSEIMGSNALGVAFDGIFVFETNAPANFTWINFSFDYTAISTSALLNFSLLLPGKGNAYYIDDIAMYAVPEPSSICLIGIGGIMSAILFRNRRKG